MLQTVLINTLFRHTFCLIQNLSDPIDEAVNQVIVQALIPVLNKTQQVNTCQILLKLAHLENRVVVNQRSVIFDAFIRNTQVRQDSLGDSI